MAESANKTPKKGKTYGKKASKKWYDIISPIKDKLSPAKKPDNDVFVAERPNEALSTLTRVLKARSTNSKGRRSGSQDYDRPVGPTLAMDQFDSKVVALNADTQPRRRVSVRTAERNLSGLSPLILLQSDKPIEASRPNVQKLDKETLVTTKGKRKALGSFQHLPTLVEGMAIVDEKNFLSMGYGPGPTVVGKTASGRSIRVWDDANIIHKHASEPEQKSSIKTLTTKKLPLRKGGYFLYDQGIARLCDLCTLHENKTGTIEFQEWCDHFDISVKKLFEGTYGEIYCGFSGKNTTASVFKVIALRPYRMPKGSKLAKMLMTGAEELAMEVQTMEAVGDIPGFVNYRGLYVLRGRMSRQFAEQWEVYHAKNGGRNSDKPNPMDPKTYAADQLWAVVEMEEAGEMLARFELRNWAEAWDISWGVIIAMAKAETQAQFEHRDLHRGNVCIKRLREPLPNTYSIKPKVLGQTGLKTTIIDFTLSRCLANAEIHDDVVFVDLNKDAALFSQDQAPGRINYQYEVYRFMRDSIFSANGGDPVGAWKIYHPQTNAFWLHFILYTIRLDLNEQTEGKHLSESEKWFQKHFNLLEQALDPRDFKAEQPRSHLVLRSDLPLESATAVVEMGLMESWISPSDLDIQEDSFAST